MKRANDLAVQFGRRCRSPRTGFIHLFLDQPGGDTIPVYENFCFAVGLIRQKCFESVAEGKDLLQRLFAFQAPKETLWDGNFPVYLHDYPRCWNSLQPLRIAPLLKGLLKEFSSILDSEFKEIASRALERMLFSIEKLRERKELPSFWERRYQALLGYSISMDMPKSSAEWAQELITRNLLGEASVDILHLIHPHLGIYAGPGAEEAQERFEPKPTLLEWWAHSTRSLQPHPLQIELAALPDNAAPAPSIWSGKIGGWQIKQTDDYSLSFSDAAGGEGEGHLLRWVWAGSKSMHSLSVPRCLGNQSIQETNEGVEITYDLPETFDVSQNDLVEATLYCNLSEETKLFVSERKATVFGLNDSLEIQTSNLTLQLRFDLIEGSGDFCGQISRSNRPLQIACRGEDLYSAFDWKISLRTLRRSPHAQLRLSIYRLCSSSSLAASSAR